jgi:hypothetical protein
MAYSAPSEEISQPHLFGIVIMTVLRRFFVAATVCGAICFGATHQSGGSAAAQTTAQNTPTASQVQVDLLRGLADIFSRGMDTLTEKLNQQGYSTRVYSTHGWQSAIKIAGAMYNVETGVVDFFPT